LHLDRAGNIWFPIEHSGIYRYDGKSFTNFHRKQGLASNAVQCFFEDREGRVWVGGVFGLFRYDGNTFFPVKKNGPWK
jgi:ligand-binding sensor domain-containing protein